MNYLKINLLIFIAFSFYIGAEEPSYEEEEKNQKSKSDIHGLFDFTFKNDYITPRGLLVSDTGLTMQILAGLSLDVYKNPKGNISRVSVDVGVWNDLWTAQHNPTAGSWNELDWFLGFTIAFKKQWKFQAQFIEFLSPPGNFKPENNAELTLFYDDSEWKLPLTLYPYVKLFWAISGDSTVVVGRRGNTYYIELGLTPTVDLSKSCFPVVFTFPSWISIGPANFWNGGKLALKHSKSHFGVFSTGFKGSIPLSFIPKTLGNWHLDIGLQYYYLINDNLLQAQLFTLHIPNIRSAKRNIGVGYLNLGFLF